MGGRRVGVGLFTNNCHRHRFHLVGQVGEALVSHVEERGLTSRLDLLVKLVGAGGQRPHGRRKQVVSLFLLATPEKLVLAVRLLRLSLDEARGWRAQSVWTSILARLGSLWSLSLLALSQLLIDLRRDSAVGSLHDEVGGRDNPDHLTVRAEGGHQPRATLVGRTPGRAGKRCGMIVSF